MIKITYTNSVCHIAGQFAQFLKVQLEEEELKGLDKRPDKPKVTDAHVLCLQIAGLCHDLGLYD